MNVFLTRKLLKTFTKEGDVVLDPMAGVGTTLVEGMLLGRNVVGVDIEDKFVKLIEGNLKNVEHINEKSRFKLRLGKAQVLCGDSRNLAQLLQDKMDAVVTSPPYSGAVSKHAGGDKVRERFEGFIGESQIEARKYSEDEANIGNLSEHGKVDTVITSPPFGEANRGSGIAKKGYAGKHGVDPKLHERHDRPLSDDPEQISNLQYGKVDVVVTSPPYADGKKGEVSPERKAKDFEEHYVPEMGGKSFHTQQRLRGVKSLVSGYSDDPENIGNLKMGEVDAVLTSPPYADGSKGKSREPLWERLAKDPTSKRFGRKQHPHIGEGYSESKENIGNLPQGNVSAIITSPPYGHDSVVHKNRSGETPVAREKFGYADFYSTDKDNVGNLKGETYLEAMLKVYREMYTVLKPGGLAIIVLKNFIRNWKVVDLIGDTVKLCEFCGFKLVKRIRFVLPQQSFWRTNYRLQWEKKFKRAFPEEEFASVYKYETVLVFQKFLSAD